MSETLFEAPGGLTGSLPGENKILCTILGQISCKWGFYLQNASTCYLPQTSCLHSAHLHFL